MAESNHLLFRFSQSFRPCNVRKFSTDHQNGLIALQTDDATLNFLCIGQKSFIEDIAVSFPSTSGTIFRYVFFPGFFWHQFHSSANCCFPITLQQSFIYFDGDVYYHSYLLSILSIFFICLGG